MADVYQSVAALKPVDAMTVMATGITWGRNFRRLIKLPTNQFFVANRYFRYTLEEMERYLDFLEKSADEVTVETVDEDEAADLAYRTEIAKKIS